MNHPHRPRRPADELPTRPQNLPVADRPITRVIDQLDEMVREKQVFVVQKRLAVAPLAPHPVRAVAEETVKVNPQCAGRGVDLDHRAVGAGGVQKPHFVKGVISIRGVTEVPVRGGLDRRGAGEGVFEVDVGHVGDRGREPAEPLERTLAVGAGVDLGGLVDAVGLQGGGQGAVVGADAGDTGAVTGHDKVGDGDGGKQSNDPHHDQQFDQGERPGGGRSCGVGTAHHATPVNPVCLILFHESLKTLLFF